MRTFLTIALYVLPFSLLAQFSTDQVANDFIKKNRSFYTVDNSGIISSQPSLFSAIDMSSYELLSANFSFAEKNNVQKIVLSPFKMAGTANRFLENFRINIALNNGITTIGAALGRDSSSPNSEKSENIFKEEFNGLPVPPLNPTPADLADYKRNTLDAALRKYNSRRTKNVIKYSIGYNVQVFGTLYAQGTANKFDSLNYHSIKSTNLTGSFNHSRNNGKFDVTLNYNYIHLRTSAAQFDQIKPYDGPSATVKLRVKKLKSGDDLDNSPEFIKSGYIPAIDVGIAYEGKYYKDSELKYAENGIKDQTVWTLFVDFKISPASQFRLGLPLTQTTNVSADKQTALGSTIQYSFKLINLN